MNKYSRYLILLLFFIVCIPLNAQNTKVVVSAKVDTNAMLIGDQIELLLSAEHSASTEVKYPFLVDSIGNFEIVDFSLIDTLSISNEIVKSQQKLLITCWDSGQYNLPVFEFRYKLGNSTRRARTQSIRIDVNDLDTPLEEGLKPNKSILDIPFSWKELIPYIIRILALLLVAFLIFFALYKYFTRKKEEEVYIAPPRSPHDVALEKIQALKKTKMWQEEAQVKEFYSQLTDIIREYIERRYKFPALESTTDEIVQDLKKETDIPKGLRERMRTLFSMADLVKFAKAKPHTDNHLQSLKDAEAFIQHTKEKESTEPITTNTVAEQVVNE